MTLNVKFSVFFYIAYTIIFDIKNYIYSLMAYKSNNSNAATSNTLKKP